MQFIQIDVLYTLDVVFHFLVIAKQVASPNCGIDLRTTLHYQRYEVAGVGISFAA